MEISGSGLDFYWKKKLFHLLLYAQSKIQSTMEKKWMTKYKNKGNMS